MTEGGREAKDFDDARTKIFRRRDDDVRCRASGRAADFQPGYRADFVSELFDVPSARGGGAVFVADVCGCEEEKRDAGESGP